MVEKRWMLFSFLELYRFVHMMTIFLGYAFGFLAVCDGKSKERFCRVVLWHYLALFHGSCLGCFVFGPKESNLFNRLSESIFLPLVNGMPMPPISPANILPL